MAAALRSNTACSQSLVTPLPWAYMSASRTGASPLPFDIARHNQVRPSAVGPAEIPFCNSELPALREASGAVAGTIAPREVVASAASLLVALGFGVGFADAVLAAAGAALFPPDVLAAFVAAGVAFSAGGSAVSEPVSTVGVFAGAEGLVAIPSLRPVVVGGVDVAGVVEAGALG